MFWRGSGLNGMDDDDDDDDDDDEHEDEHEDEDEHRWIWIWIWRWLIKDVDVVVVVVVTLDRSCIFHSNQLLEAKIFPPLIKDGLCWCDGNWSNEKRAPGWLGYMGVSKNKGTAPQNGSFIMENPYWTGWYKGKNIFGKTHMRDGILPFGI